MRKAFIYLCGLFTVVAAWAIYRDSGVGVRDAKAGTLDMGTAPRAVGAQRTTRAGLEAMIEANRQRVAAEYPREATACGEVAQNITGVNEASRQTAQGASQTETVATELSKISEQLREAVGHFQLAN